MAPLCLQVNGCKSLRSFIKVISSFGSCVSVRQLEEVQERNPDSDKYIVLGKICRILDVVTNSTEAFPLTVHKIQTFYIETFGPQFNDKVECRVVFIGEIVSRFSEHNLKKNDCVALLNPIVTYTPDGISLSISPLKPVPIVWYLSSGSGVAMNIGSRQKSDNRSQRSAKMQNFDVPGPSKSVHDRPGTTKKSNNSKISSKLQAKRKRMILSDSDSSMEVVCASPRKDKRPSKLDTKNSSPKKQTHGHPRKKSKSEKLSLIAKPQSLTADPNDSDSSVVEIITPRRMSISQKPDHDIGSASLPSRQSEVDLNASHSTNIEEIPGPSGIQNSRRSRRSAHPDEENNVTRPECCCRQLLKKMSLLIGCCTHNTDCMRNRAIVQLLELVTTTGSEKHCFCEGRTSNRESECNPAQTSRHQTSPEDSSTILIETHSRSGAYNLSGYESHESVINENGIFTIKTEPVSPVKSERFNVKEEVKVKTEFKAEVKVEQNIKTEPNGCKIEIKTEPNEECTEEDVGRQIDSNPSEETPQGPSLLTAEEPSEPIAEEPSETLEDPPEPITPPAVTENSTANRGPRKRKQLFNPKSWDDEDSDDIRAE